MLGRLQNAAVIALFACFVLGFEIEVWRASQRHPPQYEKQYSRPNKTNAKAEKISADERIADYTLALAILTGALVFVSGIQGWFLLRADKTARVTAQAAKQSADTLSRTEQAQVFIVIGGQNVSGAMKQLGMNKPSLTEDMNIGTNMLVRFTFKNYGKTPARIKEISRFLIPAVSLPDDIEYIPVDTVLKESVISANSETEAMECKLHARMTGTEIIEILRGQRSIWFYGRILYDDAVGSEHEHRFVWKYNGGSHGFRPADHPKHSKNS